MAKYDFDSYLLYEVSRMTLYTVRFKVFLSAPVYPEMFKKAAERAFRRFPYYARTVSVGKEGAFEFEACSLPIAVLDDDEPITLGSSQTNGLLFAISYKGNVVYFNFAHNFCGGFGAMFWIKSTLWQYYSRRRAGNSPPWAECWPVPPACTRALSSTACAARRCICILWCPSRRSL